MRKSLNKCQNWILFRYKREELEQMVCATLKRQFSQYGFCAGRLKCLSMCQIRTSKLRASLTRVQRNSLCNINKWCHMKARLCIVRLCGEPSHNETSHLHQRFLLYFHRDISWCNFHRKILDYIGQMCPTQFGSAAQKSEQPTTEFNLASSCLIQLASGQQVVCQKHDDPAESEMSLAM